MSDDAHAAAVALQGCVSVGVGRVGVRPADAGPRGSISDRLGLIVTRSNLYSWTPRSASGEFLGGDAVVST